MLTAKVSASITSITGHKTLLGSSAIPSNNGSNQYGAHSPIFKKNNMLRKIDHKMLVSNSTY